MKEFTLDDENIIHGFFDEMNISCDKIFEQVLEIEIPKLSNGEAQQIVEDCYDDIQDAIGNSGIRNTIEAEADEEVEVEDANGLWGHYKFIIRNETKTKSFFEKEIGKIMTVLVKQLEAEGRLKKRS
jgi:hypothetical protein